MAVWRFIIHENEVAFGEKKRRKLTGTGCNETYKGRYWCPRKRWFLREPCPFVNRTECENYRMMCGCL